MLELLPDQADRIMLSPYDLISLKDAGIRGGAFAMRPLDEEYLESLALSDPTTWPAITVTLSIRGYVVIDGYHRWEITKREGFDTIRATCKPFSDENAVIEAAFRANLHHGLKASAENKSDYVFWLHTTYPKMEQKDIAQRVGVTQSAVSKAIARKEEELRQAQQEAEKEDGEQAHKQDLQRSCRSFTRVALRFLKEFEELDDRELMQTLQAVIKKREDKMRLARIGRLLNGESSLRLRPFAASQPTVPHMPNDWAQEP
jgi:predicted transcriptional regulator